MSNPFNDQADFMIAADQSTDVYNPDQTNLYLELVAEEFKELVQSESLENLTKELADLIVVCIGCLHSLGVDPESVWDEVHRSNMSKCTDGKLVKREDGKVLKPDTYTPANTKQFIEALDFGDLSGEADVVH